MWPHLGTTFQSPLQSLVSCLAVAKHVLKAVEHPPCARICFLSTRFGNSRRVSGTRPASSEAIGRVESIFVRFLFINDYFYFLAAVQFTPLDSLRYTPTPPPGGNCSFHNLVLHDPTRFKQVPSFMNFLSAPRQP